MKETSLHLEEVATPGVHWRVLPHCRRLLFGPEGLRLEEWLKAGLARIVKHGPHRTVYHVMLPELSFYLKHYRLPDIRAWLRQLVRPAKALMEFDCALAVAARQVPTVTPLAVGEGTQGPGPGDSYLITRSLDNAEPVSTFIEDILKRLPAERQTILRQRLATALGEFVARLHETGIAHRDLHAANLLVQVEERDRLALHLIDLHAVNLGRPLAWRVSWQNLVLLNRWFVLRCSRSDRLRFWLAYRRARFGAVPRHVWHVQARDLEERTWQSNLRFWKHRDRRCLVSNRYYQRCQLGTVAGLAVRDLDSDALATLLADPDAPFRAPGAQLLKDSRSSTVAEFDLEVHGEIRRIIYKRFRVTSPKDPWLALLRRSPALRSWIYGHGLRERCLATARPLAVLRRRRHGLVYEEYLLTEKIANAVDGHQFLRALETMSAAQGCHTLRRRIEEVAQTVLELHRRNLSQRDLKASNLLLSDKGVWLIDLVGIKLEKNLSRDRRVQNLARLHVSFHRSQQLTRADKLRFLRTYLQWGLQGKNGWKQWWLDIAAATQAKVRRNLRSGRPLA